MRIFTFPLLALALLAASPGDPSGPLTPESYLPNIVLIESVPTALGPLDIGATVEGWSLVRLHGTTPVAIVPDWWLDKVGGQIEATAGVTFCIKFITRYGPWGVNEMEVHQKISATAGGSGMSLGQAVAAVASSVQQQLPPAGTFHVIPCPPTGP